MTIEPLRIIRLAFYTVPKMCYFLILAQEWCKIAQTYRLRVANTNKTVEIIWVSTVFLC